MEYSQVVQKLAACGLDCRRCADYKNGEIRELSVRLSGLLKGYERMAKIRSGSRWPSLSQTLTWKIPSIL